MDATVFSNANIRRAGVALALSTALASPAWADSFNLGVLSPSASQSTSYTGGILDDFHFQLGASAPVTIDFQGDPDAGTTYNSVEFWLRDSSFNNLAYWSGFDTSYFSSFTYTGLNSVEDYYVTVYGWPDPMSTGTGNYTMTLSTAPSIAPVPEPETYALMLAGLGLLGIAGRRRKQAGTGS